MYMEWYNGTYGIFFGDRAQAEERGEDGNVQQKRRSKDGGLQQTQQDSFTDEYAGSEDCKHTLGGVS